ncbi:MAG: 23S rRNA (adenine(2503)-C(2))-methyltransferase RlmN [Candidatus Krumholzibacteria bacterium]|nr:23S rRNA (adenine(2503)-C(2))-methyltransferase RlmN [Candidatus Krumholzibacteria bacterium]
MATNERIHIRNLALAEIREALAASGEPEYRYRQLCSWLYGRLAAGFDEMTDLSATLRESLDGEYRVTSAIPVLAQFSRIDGTRKYLFDLGGGANVEAVVMWYEKRTTLCISTQVGCPLDCVFCETATGRYRRNLTSGEILDQVCALKRDAGLADKKVNIVFMGMGEPLLNYDGLVGALHTLNDPLGLNLGAKRITVSTSGFPDRIRQLADEGVKCSLALSLNATTDEQRRELMPKASREPISELLAAARYFTSHRNRRATLEYVMLGDVNTSDDDARRLGQLTRGLPFKVNLIPYNPGRTGRYRPVSEEELQRFVRILLPFAPTVTIRRSRGADIDAACGQLWTQSLGNKNPAGGAR